MSLHFLSTLLSSDRETGSGGPRDRNPWNCCKTCFYKTIFYLLLLRPETGVEDERGLVIMSPFLTFVLPQTLHICCDSLALSSSNSKQSASVLRKWMAQISKRTLEIGNRMSKSPFNRNNVLKIKPSVTMPGNQIP